MIWTYVIGLAIIVGACVLSARAERNGWALRVAWVVWLALIIRYGLWLR